MGYLGLFFIVRVVLVIINRVIKVAHMYKCRNLLFATCPLKAPDIFN